MVIFNDNECVDICVKNTNSYVRLAVEDLRKDFAKVRKNEEKPSIIDKESDFCIVIEDNVITDNPLQDESFKIISENNKIRIFAKSYLGTIWGIYTFSEKILGVDPCYLFNDWEIEKRIELEVKDVFICETPQRVGFRGAFINDEDLITGWKDGGGLRRLDYMYYGITVDYSVMDMIVETVLRLKLNLVIPASFLDIDNPPEKALADCVVRRGIFISQHHLEPLGVSHFTFENYCKKYNKDGNYSFIQNPKLLEEVWRYYVKKWAEYENVVWQVGLRGKADRPMWEETEPSADDLKIYGKYISDAIREQKKIVLEETRGKTCYFTSTLWMEGSLLMENNAIELDDDTIIVFADNGPNQMFGKDYDNVPRLKNLNYGIYYHLQYFGLGPHLAPQTGLNKLYYNIKKAWDKGDNSYFILNISNVREFVFELKAYSEMIWDLDGFSKDDYLDRYCSAYGNSAENIKALINDYYESLPQLETKYLAKMSAKYFNYNYDEISPGIKNFVLKEGLVIHSGRGIILSFYKPLESGLYKEIYEELKKAIPIWETLVSRFESVCDDLHGGAKKHLDVKWLLYSQTLLCAYRWYVNIYEAKTNYDNCNDDKTKKSLTMACEILEKYLSIRKRAEYGNFKNWYRGDLKMDLKQRLCETKRLLGQTPDYL